MAARGDVLSLRHALGFLPGARIERFLVLQSDRLAAALDTVIGVPLDEARKEYSRLPGAVPVSAAESGARHEQVALVTQLTCMPLERFEPGRSGRLRPATLARVARVAKLILELE